MENNNICQTTIKRLIKDIKDIKKNPLEQHGIYYKHDDTDILKGQALIIGPQDTPYQYGYYLFDFIFPTNYPHSPPNVKYLTNDGNTRFNPNLYKNGKVCLSILNTWRGENWTGCQSISTTLLTLVTILHNMPLSNEPGFDDKHPANIPYNKILTYKNFDTAICYMLTDFNIDKNKHYDTMKELFIHNYDKIIDTIHSIDDYKKSKMINCSVYNMSTVITYTEMLIKLKDLFIKLK